MMQSSPKMDYDVLIIQRVYVRSCCSSNKALSFWSKKRYLGVLKLDMVGKEGAI